MRVHEAKTRALAMPFKNSETSQQKSRKCVFRPFFNWLFQTRPKYYEFSKTEYSDSTSFINRCTPLIFFLGVWSFFEGLNGGFPPKNLTFFLLLSHDNRLTWIYSLFTAPYDDYSFQNLTKKMPTGVFAPPPWIGLMLLVISILSLWQDGKFCWSQYYLCNSIDSFGDLNTISVAVLILLVVSILSLWQYG